jgi:protein-S-isoprenylcysteine O-methyltransferase Ste14
LKQIHLNILSVLGYLFMVAGVLLLGANRGLFSPHPAVILAQVAAIALMIWARQTFGRRSFHLAAEPTEGGLVTSGPYRYIRHPIYTSILVFVWAGIAAHWSILNAFFGVLIIAGSLMRTFCEEQLVRIRYPDYDVYASTTKRMIPYLF